MEGLIFGLINGGKFACFKIDWASLACSGNEITIFALFYLVFEGKFQVQTSQGAYIRRGDLTEGFLRYDFGGLIFGGAYFWNFRVVSFAAVLRVATQRSSCVTNLKTAAKEASG